MLSGDDRVKICDFGSAQCEDFPVCHCPSCLLIF
jgi:hypothetical protein